MKLGEQKISYQLIIKITYRNQVSYYTAIAVDIFGVKKRGFFLLQLTRKDGDLQVSRLQFFRTDQQRLRLRRVVIDSQPSDLQMTTFSSLLHRKIATFPHTERPFCQQNMKFSHF